MSDTESMRYAGEDEVPDSVARRCVRCPHHRWATFFRGLGGDGAVVAASIDELLDDKCPGAWPEPRESHGIKLPDEYACQHPAVLDGTVSPLLETYYQEGMIVMAGLQAAQAAEWLLDDGHA